MKISMGLPNEIKIKSDYENFDIGLKVSLMVYDKEEQSQIANLECEIRELFGIKIENKESELEILKMLKYNCVTLLFQELRAYIQI